MNRSSPAPNSPAQEDLLAVADAQIHYVLVVEDDPVFAKLLKTILSSSCQETYQCVIADSLQGATVLLESHSFDVIIADLGLPDSQAHHTVEGLLDAAPTVPIIVLTGTDEGVDQSLSAVRKGATYFLRKGNVDQAAVERGLRYAIGRKQLRNLLDDER